ncbi:MAG: MFS transporter [Pseudoclavibacter caeni]|jgi:MFS transporter, CP family, cyanate transporter
MTPRLRASGDVLLGICAVALVLRSPLTAVPPALSQIAVDLHLSAAATGATTTLPLLCFAAFSFLAPVIAGRCGAAAAMRLGLVGIIAGALLRPLGSLWAFFVGTALIGMGIAVGNVLVPVIVRERLPGRIAGTMTAFSSTMGFGAMLGSLATGPLLDAGWTWRAVLALAIPVSVLVSLIWWRSVPVRANGAAASPSAVRRAEGAAHAGDAAVDLPAGAAGAPEQSRWAIALRRPQTWLVTALMGLQSLVFYTELTWLPAQLTAAGMSVTAASVALALYNGLGIAGSAFMPRLVDSRHGRAGMIAGFTVYLGGLSLLLAGRPWLWAAVAVIGLMQGAAIATALMLIAQTAAPAITAETSATAQGIGYLIAAVGPAVLGALADRVGWAPPIVLLDVALVCCAAIGTALLGPHPDGHG